MQTCRREGCISGVYEEVIGLYTCIDDWLTKEGCIPRMYKRRVYRMRNCISQDERIDDMYGRPTTVYSAILAMTQGVMANIYAVLIVLCMWM